MKNKIATIVLSMTFSILANAGTFSSNPSISCSPDRLADCNMSLPPVIVSVPAMPFSMSNSMPLILSMGFTQVVGQSIYIFPNGSANGSAVLNNPKTGAQVLVTYHANITTSAPGTYAYQICPQAGPNNPHPACSQTFGNQAHL